jgi:hypothetical protein
VREVRVRMGLGLAIERLGQGRLGLGLARKGLHGLALQC